MNATLAASLLFLAQAGPPQAAPQEPPKFQCEYAESVVLRANELQQSTGKGVLLVLKGKDAETYLDALNAKPPPDRLSLPGGPGLHHW